MQNDDLARQYAARSSTWVSVVVNIVLSALQLVVGVFSHSAALVADGIHSFSDLLSDFVVLFVNRYSHHGADDNHPYGHARFENAASLVLGVLLLSVGLGMLWSAAEKIQHPELISTVHRIALWIACLTLVSKELLFRFMLRVAKRVKSSLLVANAWHARSDAASSFVVGLGIVGNLLGYPFLDPLAAALVGFMVARMGWKFGWSALSDLMDHGLAQQEVDVLRATLVTTPGVRNIHDLRTRRMGDQALVDVHLLVDGHISVSEGHYIAARARRELLAAHPFLLDVLIHIDPEDDQQHDPATPSIGQLPARSTLLISLQQALGEQWASCRTLQLHYLDGAIELEVVLDAHADGTRLAQQVYAWAAGEPVICHVCAQQLLRPLTTPST